MSLRSSYTRLAPVYDWLIGPALARVRARSLARLPAAGAHIFLNGIGTGLDLPLLPATHRYTALDLTRAMLDRAQPRRGKLDVQWVQGDSQRLPFRDDSFDHVLLHLILAIVPDSRAALRESARVVRTGGKNDPSDNTGMAHYLEHMLFKGTQSLGTTDWAAERPLQARIEQLYEQQQEKQQHQHLFFLQPLL